MRPPNGPAREPIVFVSDVASVSAKRRDRAFPVQSADLFLPVVPAAVDPKQELQSEQTAFDAQYVTPKDI